MAKDALFPDFRNTGVILRAALAAQALILALGVAKGMSVEGGIQAYLELAAYCQLPLLIILLLLFALAPFFRMQPPWTARVMALFMSASIAGVWHLFMSLNYPDATSGSLPRTLALTLAGAWLILTGLEGRARRLSPALAEARLQALTSRIRPHFLFNALNSVLSLMRSDPAKAEHALENLAELQRALLSENRDLSTLRREMELAQAYLELESLRLGERLQVDWRAANAPMEAALPALILQPLLENAVCHGIEPLAEGGRIGVDIFTRQGELNLVVKNPCPPLPTGATPGRVGNRMALTNIRERLALHFDAQARLSIQQPAGAFIVQVALPLRTLRK
jgi:two-component system sensor histidine kinase AlgZ